MIKILFICHGNICRSTMAEQIMKHLVREAGREDEFVIDSEQELERMQREVKMSEKIERRKQRRKSSGE